MGVVATLAKPTTKYLDDLDAARLARENTVLVFSFVCALLLLAVAITAAVVAVCCARRIARYLYQRWRTLSYFEETEVEWTP